MVQRQTLLFFFMALAVSIAGFSQTQSQSPAATSKPVPDARSELAAKLLNVKRIYVVSFGDDEESKSLQAMVINALDESKRFIVTENKDKADAILRVDQPRRPRRKCMRRGKQPRKPVPVAIQGKPWGSKTQSFQRRRSMKRASRFGLSRRMAM